jgi:hypothetical protein
MSQRSRMQARRRGEPFGAGSLTTIRVAADFPGKPCVRSLSFAGARRNPSVYQLGCVKNQKRSRPHTASVHEAVVEGNCAGILRLLAGTAGTIIRLSTDSEHRILQPENLRPVPLWLKSEK